MTSAVTKAMIEAYALMVMVMGTFFIYFCGMVWAFSNPKLSGAEEEEEEGADEGLHPPAVQLCAQAGPTHVACVNFWNDTDVLLSDFAAFSREDQGIINQIVEV